MNKVILEDKELGTLIITPNARARKMVFRTKSDAIHITVPTGTAMSSVKQAVEQLREKLLAARRKVALPVINLDYRIDTDLFHLSLHTGESSRFIARTDALKVQIFCPPQTDFADEELQIWLRKVIKESLRRQAKLLLPARLKQCAERAGLTYHTVRINSSQSRWGSCSSRKDINLSFYLLLLPAHLIDYVMLHELCHTLEMNHSPRFWAHLNSLTNGKAEALRKELKGFRTEL